MSGGASRAKDPFAGYVPVKPAIPVVDSDVPEVPQDRPRPRRRPPKREWGVAQKIRAALVRVVVAVLIVAVAVVTYGFVYGQPTEEMTPEFVSYLERVRPLVDLGRSLRAKFDETPALKSLGERTSSALSGE